MKTLILGDIHGRWAQADAFYEFLTEKYGTFDLAIQLGDFGFWPRVDRFSVWDRNFDHPCLWLDGNHEDHETLARLQEESWGFGKTQSPLNLEKWQNFLDRWEYQPRGTIRDGHLFVGGARSIDAFQRIRGVDWFLEENISYAQQRAIFEAVEDYGPENIHTVFSHDCPGAFDVKEACVYSKVEVIDGNRKFLQALLEYVKPEQWFFGHYHKPMTGTDSNTGCIWRCVDMIRPKCKLGWEYHDAVVMDLPFSANSFSS